MNSEAKLPVELAREREQRAARLHKAALPLEGLPTVKLPYRMWRAPALDFIVSAGVTYQASNGLRVDRSASIVAAGEIARLSYDAMLSSDSKGRPQSLRLRAYRSDPDGGLLGPLQATHFAVGDVDGLSSRLVSGASGRGAQVTNRPLFNPVAFDRTRFEGDLPPGWDAELYRNGELLAFSRSDGSSRYVFDDVPMIYGDNRFEIILYGPQGQQRSRARNDQCRAKPGASRQDLVLGGDQPAGAQHSQQFRRTRRRRRAAREREPGDFRRPDLQAAVQVEHGLDKKTSIGLLATTLLADNERLTFVEGSVRRSIGPALVEAAVARDSNGGVAARVQGIARLGSVNVSAEASTPTASPSTAGGKIAIATRGSRSMRRSKSAASGSPPMATFGSSIAAAPTGRSMRMVDCRPISTVST